MNIYNDYLSTIKSAMSADKEQKRNFSNLSGQDELIKGNTISNYLNESENTKPLPSLLQFANEFGLKTNYDQSLGSHPDFSHLKHSGKIEKHYVVSMFIDIKGSTNLFKRYSPETVFIITNTIQRAAIHTGLIFNGYIQRLHGDGLFVYFGGKDCAKNQATKNALQAASVFSYFIKNDLKKLFNEQGVETIFTRIGIDLGENKDVVWAMAGIGEISEVTTCSLHTSLASKMQSNAESNGVVVGDNVKNNTDTPFYSPVCNRTNNESDRYIFRNYEDNFNYTQYDFNWIQYLKQQDFVATDLNGNLSIKRKLAITDRIPQDIIPIASQNKPYFRG
jgi:class 3 adenylate cyclase